MDFWLKSLCCWSQFSSCIHTELLSRLHKADTDVSLLITRRWCTYFCPSSGWNKTKLHISQNPAPSSPQEIKDLRLFDGGIWILHWVLCFLKALFSPANSSAATFKPLIRSFINSSGAVTHSSLLHPVIYPPRLLWKIPTAPNMEPIYLLLHRSWWGRVLIQRLATQK